MDRFIDKTRVRSELRSRAATSSLTDKQPGQHSPRCAMVAPGQHSPRRRKNSFSPHLSQEDSPNCSQADSPNPASIAQEVVKLLMSTINEAVDKSVSQGIHQLRQEVVVQAQHVTDVEQKISAIEDDLPHIQGSQIKQDKLQQMLLDRIEDLEKQ